LKGLAFGRCRVLLARRFHCLAPKLFLVAIALACAWTHSTTKAPALRILPCITFTTFARPIRLATRVFALQAGAATGKMNRAPRSTVDRLDKPSAYYNSRVSNRRPASPVRAASTLTQLAGQQEGRKGQPRLRGGAETARRCPQGCYHPLRRQPVRSNQLRRRCPPTSHSHSIADPSTRPKSRCTSCSQSAARSSGW
jgi:hypothetical protein